MKSFLLKSKSWKLSRNYKPFQFHDHEEEEKIQLSQN